MSEWALPVVLTPKKDEKVRFCVKYRTLNAMAVRDPYPLPRMEECTDSLSDETIFPTADCHIGYWPTEIPEADRYKTTFSSHHGLFRIIQMPLGLKNEPTSFQRIVNLIPTILKSKYALLHLVDIIVYSKSVTELLLHVRTVFTLLQNDGAALKFSKCSFFDDRVSYLGHTAQPRKLVVDYKNCETVTKSLFPTNQTGLGPF